MKRLIKLSFILAVTAMAATSCNCYKKMGKNIDSVNVVCSPEVLALNKGKVPAEISVEIPAKYFAKSAILRVTPVLIYPGGELKADPIMLQGEKASENYRVVSYSSGIKINESISFDYSPEIRRSKLQLRIEALCKCTECDEFVLLNAKSGMPISATEIEILESEPNSEAARTILRLSGLDVANGINTLQGEFDFSEMMEMMADDFKRVTTSVETLDINYGISSSVVNTKSLKSENVAAFESNVADYVENDRATQTLFANGYASPDGPEAFNEKLSKARSESTKSAMSKILAKYGVDIDVAAYGEDWDGFKALVEASNIKDKGLILQVLSLHDSSSQREAEIKNLAEVFEELKSEILPQLRRAQLSNKIEMIGKSDEEMLALVKAKRYMDLNEEELLYICEKLSVNNDTKVILLDFAAKKYESARAYNNLGVLYAQMDKNCEASKAFAEAAKCGASGSEFSKNMALISLEKGDIKGAKDYAKGADAEVSAAIAVAEGNYSVATKSMSGYNAAVAYIQLGNYTAAKGALKGNNSPKAEYLMAVIASMEGDIKTSASKLASAVRKDNSLAEKAADDVNLKNLYDSGIVK